MDDLEKLKHLIGHWAEHNDEHAKTYLEWSGRMAAMGKKELSEVLKEISEETLRLGELFRKAEELI
ncbi:MAG: hypothetical protein P8013_13465 [Candidatus Sulfobium sp.]|jgi:hypothetical protein